MQPQPLVRFFAAIAAHWRVGLLTLVTAVVWVAHYDRWTLESWSLPTNYSGDALEILTRIQAAAEGDTVPFRQQTVSRLGAPFGANWSAYPSSDLLLIWGLGRVASVVGVFPTANLAMLLAAVSAALAFYGCARWLRVRWEWAFATALLFGFTFQTFHRGLPHLFFLFSWTVPLALLASGIVASSRRTGWRKRSGAFCIGTAAVIGVSNPYTLFLFLQLLGWALIAQWIGPRRRENIQTGLVALAVAVAAFFIVESHVWLFATDTAAASPLERNYGGTERYALKPIELLLPPAGHRWDAFAFLGNRYLRWSEWRGGEAFFPYLGLVGIAGLGCLGYAALRAIWRRRRIPGPALPAGWVLAFASMGAGTNIMVFFTGLFLFRASNRFSVFISAVVLLFLAARLARWSQARPAWLSLAAAALLAAFGLADQLPRAPGPAEQVRIAGLIDTDDELGRMLEGQLAPGAMVFQLPVLMFPEAPVLHQLGDYEHFRLYLATRSLRFSYGVLKGRSRGRWQRDAEELPTAELVRRLESYGFSALYLNRSGFADRGEKVLAELTAIGRTRRIEGARREQVVVMLQPGPKCEMPVARRLTFGRGWHKARVGEPRWAYGPASLSYYNPHPYPMKTTVRLVMSSVGPRNIGFRWNRGERIARPIDGARCEVSLSFTLRPGVNRLDVESRETALRLSNEPDQLRSFAVHESTVGAVAEPHAGAVKGEDPGGSGYGGRGLEPDPLTSTDPRRVVPVGGRGDV